jgi:hypothetical protein
MAVMEVRNDHAGWLVLWLEPLGEDRWLRPGETFRIQSDYIGGELAFSVVSWVHDDDRAAGIENITVCIEHRDAYAQVTDRAGNILECGHQRPAEIDSTWAAAREELEERTPQA